MADGGMAASAVASVAASADDFSVDYECPLCSNQYDPSDPKRAPYRTCLGAICHYACGGCIETMIRKEFDDRYGDYHNLQGSDGEPVIVNYSSSCIEIGLFRYYDRYGRGYYNGRFTFSCPTCRQKKECEKGSQFYRDKCYESLLVGGLKPEDTCAKASLAIRSAGSVFDDAQGGVQRVINIMMQEAGKLRETEEKVSASIEKMKMDILKMVEEENDIKKRISEEQLKLTALGENYECKLSEMKRRARDEVLDELEEMRKEKMLKIEKEAEEARAVLEMEIEDMKVKSEKELAALRAKNEDMKARLRQEYLDTRDQYEEKIADAEEKYEKILYDLRLNYQIENHTYEEKLRNSKIALENFCREMSMKTADENRRFDAFMHRLESDKNRQKVIHERMMEKMRLELISTTREHRKQFERELERLSFKEVVERIKSQKDRDKIVTYANQHFAREIREQQRKMKADIDKECQKYREAIRCSYKAHEKAKHDTAMAEIDRQNERMTYELEQKRSRAMARLAKLAEGYEMPKAMLKVWWEERKAEADAEAKAGADAGAGADADAGEQ